MPCPEASQRPRRFLLSGVTLSSIAGLAQRLKVVQTVTAVLAGWMNVVDVNSSVVFGQQQATPPAISVLACPQLSQQGEAAFPGSGFGCRDSPAVPASSAHPFCLWSEVSSEFCSVASPCETSSVCGRPRRQSPDPNTLGGHDSKTGRRPQGSLSQGQASALWTPTPRARPRPHRPTLRSCSEALVPTRSSFLGALWGNGRRALPQRARERGALVVAYRQFV